MKKVILLSVLASVVGFYACKKDGTTTTVTNTVHDTTIVTTYATGVVNADTLTAGLKVGYGSNITGTFPAASTDASAPVLDTLYNKTYTVIKSRYLTIYPPNVSGTVAGYYVQIAGAASYFKIDYTQAYNLRKAAKQARLAARKSTSATTTRGSGDGFIDSTIVFKIPAAINGDTFYVKYAAYDDQGRVSAAVTARVLILPEGTEAFTDSIVGTWKYYGYNEYYNGAWYYEGYQIDTGYADSQYYTCSDSMLVATGTSEGTYIPYYTYTYSDIIGVSKYSFSRSWRYLYQGLDVNTSTCSNYVYTVQEDYNYNNAGGFSYDPKSKKVTLIYEYEGASSIDLSYDTYYLSELTSTYMVLSYRSNESSDYNGYIDYYKYIKQ